jgi:cytidylate kinase
MPSALNSQNSLNSTRTQHIWVVTGPAGCGKSTVGQALRKDLGLSFLEGDDVWRPCPTLDIPNDREEEKATAS